MSSTVLYMSLDGFIAGPNVRPDHGLGDGGGRLHEWPFPGAADGANHQIYDEFMSTGAIVAGSGTFDPQAAGKATITTVCRFTSSAATRHPPGRPNGLPCTM